MFALGEKTGLFADAAARRRAVVHYVLLGTCALLLALNFGWSVSGVHLVFVAVVGLFSAIFDRQLRRRELARVLRDVPEIEPPRTDTRMMKR